MLDAPTQTAQKPVLRVTDLRKISLLLIILLIMTKLCNKKFNARCTNSKLEPYFPNKSEIIIYILNKEGGFIIITLEFNLLVHFFICQISAFTLVN